MRDLSAFPFDETSGKAFLLKVMDSQDKVLAAQLHYALAIHERWTLQNSSLLWISDRVSWIDRASTLLTNQTITNAAINKKDVETHLQAAKTQAHFLNILSQRLAMQVEKHQLATTVKSTELQVLTFSEYETGNKVQGIIDKLLIQPNNKSLLITLYERVAFGLLKLEEQLKIARQWQIWEIEVMIEPRPSNTTSSHSPEKHLEEVLNNFQDCLYQNPEDRSLLAPTNTQFEVVLETIWDTFLRSDWLQTSIRATSQTPVARRLAYILEQVEATSTVINRWVGRRITVEHFAAASQDSEHQFWGISKALRTNQTATPQEICAAYLFLAKEILCNLGKYNDKLTVVVKVACTLYHLTFRHDFPKTANNWTSLNNTTIGLNQTFGGTSQGGRDPNDLKASMRDKADRLLDYLLQSCEEFADKDHVTEAKTILATKSAETSQNTTVTRALSRADLRSRSTSQQTVAARSAAPQQRGFH